MHEYKWILDADVEGFFDNINHEYLLNNLFLPFSGIYLVKRLLSCGVVDKHIFSTSESGVPQGGILSPVLANFTLNGLQDVVYKAIHSLTKSKARRIPLPKTKIFRLKDEIKLKFLGYNLIAKINSYLRGWGYYFNLGNCAKYRSLTKNLVYKMCRKWVHKRHKRWGKRKLQDFIF